MGSKYFIQILIIYLFLCHRYIFFGYSNMCGSSGQHIGHGVLVFITWC